MIKTGKQPFDKLRARKEEGNEEHEKQRTEDGGRKTEDGRCVAYQANLGQVRDN